MSVEDLRLEFDYMKERVSKLEKETEKQNERILKLHDEVRETIDAKIERNMKFNDEKFSEIIDGLNNINTTQAAISVQVSNSVKDLDELSNKVYEKDKKAIGVIYSFIVGFILFVIGKLVGV